MDKKIVISYFVPTSGIYQKRSREVYVKNETLIKKIHKKFAEDINADYICYGKDMVDNFWNIHPKYKNALDDWMKIHLSKFHTLDLTSNLEYDKIACIDFDVMPVKSGVDLFESDEKFIVDNDNLNFPNTQGQKEIFQQMKEKVKKIGINHQKIIDGGLLIMEKNFIKEINIHKYFDEWLDKIFNTFGKMEEWLCSEEIYLMYYMEKEKLNFVPFNQMIDIRYDISNVNFNKKGLYHFYNKDLFQKFLESVKNNY